METTAHNQSSGATVTHRSSTHSSIESVMRLLFQPFLILAFVCLANSSVAAPVVAFEFEQEQESEDEWIHAKANCHTTRPQLYQVLNAIIKYPALHSWIRDTEMESNKMHGGQRFLIEFKFPWPVGKQWSRVEVRKSGDSIITWRQLEGTLKKNRGRIAITEHQHEAHIDYRAIIDVGYPNAVTRSYRKKFVMEFLRAIYEKTRDSNHPSDEKPTGLPETIIAASTP